MTSPHEEPERPTEPPRLPDRPETLIAAETVLEIMNGVRDRFRELREIGVVADPLFTLALVSAFLPAMARFTLERKSDPEAQLRRWVAALAAAEREAAASLERVARLLA